MTPDDPVLRRVVAGESTLGRIVFMEHALSDDRWFADHKFELAEAAEVLDCTMAARVHEELTLTTVRTSREETVSAMLRREEAEVVETGSEAGSARDASPDGTAG